MSIQDPKGTNGRMFGGDCDLIHVPNGTRKIHGKQAADFIDRNMRQAAFVSGNRTKHQSETQDLCPGCYSIVLFNAAVELAKRSGFSHRDLGRTLAAAFSAMAACDGDPECIEDIVMKLERVGEANNKPVREVA